MIRALFIFLLISATAFAEKPWPGVEFAEVRAYAWPVVLPGMKLKPGAVNQEGAVLTPEQAIKLLNAVTGKHAYHPKAACYMPHNAFVFYDEHQKPVANVEICFECLNYAVSPDGGSEFVDLVALAALFDAHQLPMGEYPNSGTFKKRFEEIQKSVTEAEEAEKPWPGVEFAQVRAYAWPKELRETELILPGMKLTPGAINPQGAVLTSEQVKKLLDAVTGKHPEHAGALCYHPHNAVVFYDSDQEPVAYVEICFECMGHRKSPVGSAKFIDLLALASLFDEHQLPMGTYADLRDFPTWFKSFWSK